MDQISETSRLHIPECFLNAGSPARYHAFQAATPVQAPSPARIRSCPRFLVPPRNSRRLLKVWSQNYSTSQKCQNCTIHYVTHKRYKSCEMSRDTKSALFTGHAVVAKLVASTRRLQAARDYSDSWFDTGNRASQSRFGGQIGPVPPSSKTRGFDERGNPDKINCIAQVVGKGNQAELAAHVLETPHQQRSLFPSIT